MDSGSAECVWPRRALRTVFHWWKLRQGQTYHTTDGGVIKNKGGKDRDDALRDW